LGEIKVSNLRKTILVLTIAVLIAGIVLVIAYRHEPAQPTNNQHGNGNRPSPSIVSYTWTYCSTTINVVNNGAEGWCKVGFDGFMGDYIGHSAMHPFSQRTYLKKGEYATLQFAYSIFDPSVQMDYCKPISVYAVPD
jgi:hypothetical protein